MSTPQEVIKKFMASLDNTSLRGAEAVNEAVAAASNGMFSDTQAAIDSLLADMKAVSKEEFLTDYCGIILDNDDTGSIIGSDAGGAIVYTSDTIVNEKNTAVLTAPAEFTISGVTFHALSYMGPEEHAILDRIYTWWINGSLELIENAFGISFNEADASVKDIYIKFYNSYGGTIAYVETNTDSTTGKTNSIDLNINTSQYSNLDINDPNGKINDSLYNADRTLAHELTHAVMAATTNYFNDIPNFVSEGLAELVHGADDYRKTEIMNIAGNSKAMEAALDLNITDGSNYDKYAAGYVFFRYLAHKVGYYTEKKDYMELSNYSKDNINTMPLAEFSSNISDENTYGALSSNEVSKIKLQDGKLYNAAFDYNKDGNISITNSSSQNIDFYVMEGKNNTIKVTGNGKYEYSGDWTNTYTSGSWASTVNAYMMGKDSNVSIAAADNIYTGAGTNVVWGYTVDNADITLKADGGEDYVILWDSVDNNVNVSNFDYANDTVWLYGRGNSLKGEAIEFLTDIDTLLHEYSFSNKGSVLTISGINGSIMTINGKTDSFKLMTSDLNQSYTVKFDDNNHISIYDVNNNLAGQK